MEKWNYILREEIGEKDKEGRHVFLADRILSEAPREYGERVSEERIAGEKAYVTRMQRVVIKSTDCSSAYLRQTVCRNCSIRGFPRYWSIIGQGKIIIWFCLT